MEPDLFAFDFVRGLSRCIKLSEISALEAAEEAHRFLGNPNYPIDPEESARRLGCRKVDRIPLSPIHGVYIPDLPWGPLILLNKLDPRYVQRMSCAHELAHYLKDPKGEIDILMHPSLYGTLPGVNLRQRKQWDNAFAKAEHFSTKFAGAFLMRVGPYRRDLRRMSLRQLSIRYMVSPEAALRRITELIDLPLNVIILRTELIWGRHEPHRWVHLRSDHQQRLLTEVLRYWRDDDSNRQKLRRAAARAMRQRRPVFEPMSVSGERWVSMVYRLNRFQIAIVTARASEMDFIEALGSA